MGIDFREDDNHASWSYSGFGIFRDRLAKSIGVELRQMEGFGGTRQWNQIQDDLVPFLNHSDCDGELAPGHCAKVAKRIMEVTSRWPDSIEHRYDKEQARALVKAMKFCAKYSKPLEFR